MYIKKKRAKRVAVDSKQIRLRTLVIFCFVLLAPTLYLSYCISGGGHQLHQRAGNVVYSAPGLLL